MKSTGDSSVKAPIPALILEYRGIYLSISFISLEIIALLFSILDSFLALLKL